MIRQPTFARFSSLMLAGFVMAIVAASGRTDDVIETPQTAPTADASADTEPAVFGIAVRLSEGVFRSPSRFVSRTTPVQQTIVGVYNTGTAQVTGELIPDIRPKKDGVAMDLTFQGRSLSHTVGRVRGARITTSTTTGVSVRTPVTFTLENGFVAGESHSAATILGTRQCVASEVHGLRGLIVRRVARNRIAQQQSQIRYESSEATRTRVGSDARQEVDQELQRLNAQLEPWRQFLLAQAWYQANQKIEYSSDEQHLILTVRGTPRPRAPEPAPEETVDFPPVQLPAPVQGGLVDVIFYEDPADKQKVSLILKVVEAFIDEYTAELPIADRLTFETTDGPNWVKLSVSEGPAGRRVRAVPQQQGTSVN